MVVSILQMLQKVRKYIKGIFNLNMHISTHTRVLAAILSNNYSALRRLSVICVLETAIHGHKPGILIQDT